MRELEQEAEAIAAALEGRPAAEQRAVLAALGAQRQRQLEQSEAEADGFVPGWLAQLPPELQQELRSAGLVKAMREHAAAVRRDEAAGGGVGLEPEARGGCQLLLRGEKLSMS